MCFAPQRRALFMSHLASWLRTRRFSEPTFRPSGATNHWKNTVNRDFPIFSRICIFFLLILSLLTRLTSAFQLSILSEVSLLNFLRLYLHYAFLTSPASSIFGIFRRLRCADATPSTADNAREKPSRQDPIW